MNNLPDNSKCCGCKLCAYICPVKAITFEEDIYGFWQYKINDKKCIGCGKCERLCPVCKCLEKKTPIDGYAGIAKDKNLLMSSASGGIFAALATWVIGEGGIVYGACMQQDKELILRISHLRIDNCQDLPMMQRSKYVQSDMGDIYSSIKGDLSENKKVLFAGTPCQCAAVRSVFGDNNLLLIASFLN